MKKKKGISLIVLIITIIVVIILAVTVILTITKNNPIESAKEAVFKEDVRAFQDELNMYISKEYTNLQGQRDSKITAKGYGKDGEKDSVYTYVPDFKKKYEGKLAIKEDMIAYVGTDAKEKEWLLNSGVYIAKTLIVKYVDQDGNKLKEDESITLMDNYYSVDVPEIEGYIRFSEKLEGKISQDSEVIAEYYLENDNLAFMGLDASGNETTEEASIVSYEVIGIGECNASKIAIPREYNGKPVKKIKKEAFNGDIKLESIIIDNNIESIESTAFNTCINLKHVSINSISVPTSCFYYCKNLESIIIGKCVSSLGNAFIKGNVKLIGLTILTDKVDIDNSVIGYYSPYLKEIKVNEDNSKYKTENGILLSKDGTKIYAYPTGKEDFYLPKSVTEIGNSSFRGCNKFKEINISNQISKIGMQAFTDCNNLVDLKLDCEIVSYRSFWYCKNLENVEIGKNVKSLGADLFSGDNKIISINYLGNKEEWNNLFGKLMSWKSGNSTITKVICNDGEISL